jgi:nitroimidazol reductase NimA-like FMN-containing flavoprotein (pyridoxamine 5'-phosphate oxidase superfamily)
MKHVDYVYTVGMTDTELDEFLRLGEHGVLGLADGDDAYAVPLSYHYDGTRLLLRVSDHDDDSEKRQFLEATETATFIVYGASTADSWSIQVRGPIGEFESDVEEATLREWFPPFRLFDEAVEAVDFSLFELEMESVVGRQTVE